MCLALTVIIPAYRRAAALACVLEGLAQQNCAALRFEVLVVVDGGDSGVCRLLGEYDYTKSSDSRKRYITIPEGGPAVSRNRGAALAHGEVLLFLDDDIIPSNTLVSSHLKLHEHSPGAVGLGRIERDEARRLNRFERYLYGFYDTHYAKMGAPGYQPTFWDALTGNLSVRAEAFRAAGGFDEAFSLMRHEDIELGYRLSRMGQHFHYLPEALGYHQYTKTFARGCQEAYVNGISSVMMAARYPELRAALIDARWNALPGWARAAACLAVRLSRAQVMAILCPLSERAPSLLLYRAAYHLSFWQGVRQGRRQEQGG